MCFRHNGSCPPKIKFVLHDFREIFFFNTLQDKLNLGLARNKLAKNKRLIGIK